MFTLSAPGKTFLSGEYLALKGGPAVVLSLAPRFRLKVRRGQGHSPFHPESPAGKLVAQHPEVFAGLDLEFVNPYNQGGFGGSTAEFLLANALVQFGPGAWTEHQFDLDVRRALSDYRDLHKDHAVKPSGADLVAQSCGWVTGFDRRGGKIQVFAWPFPHLGFMTFATGLKVATHEHLKDLVGRIEAQPDLFEALETPAQVVWDSFVKRSEGQFLVGMNDFNRALEAMGLVNETVAEKTRLLKQVNGVRVVKGCGALGADVVLAVYDRRELRENELIAFARTLNLRPIANESDLSHGLDKDPADIQTEKPL